MQALAAVSQRASPVQALADGLLGALGRASLEKEIEELRLRLAREAEEHFQREAKKLLPAGCYDCGRDFSISASRFWSFKYDGEFKFATTEFGVW